MTAATRSICEAATVYGVGPRGGAGAKSVHEEVWAALQGDGCGDLVFLDLPEPVGPQGGDALSFSSKSSISAAEYLAAATVELELAWKVVAKRGYMAVSVRSQKAAAYAPSIDLPFEVQRLVASLPGAQFRARVVVVNRDAVLDWRYTPAIEPVSTRLFVYRKGLS